MGVNIHGKGHQDDHDHIELALALCVSALCLEDGLDVLQTDRVVKSVSSQCLTELVFRGELA